MASGMAFSAGIVCEHARVRIAAAGSSDFRFASSGSRNRTWPRGALPGEPRKFRFSAHWVAACAILAVAIAVAAIYAVRRFCRPPAAALSAVLSNVVSTTKGVEFEQVVQLGLRIDIEQSPFVTLVSKAGVQQTLQEMQRTADTRLTAAVAREVCDRNNAQIMLQPALTRVGSRYLLTLEAIDCQTGNSVAGVKRTPESGITLA